MSWTGNTTNIQSRFKSSYDVSPLIKDPHLIKEDCAKRRPYVNTLIPPKLNSWTLQDHITWHLFAQTIWHMLMNNGCFCGGRIVHYRLWSELFIENKLFNTSALKYCMQVWALITKRALIN